YGLGRSHPTIVGMAARGLTDPVLLETGSAAALESALLARDPTDPTDAPAAAAIVAALAQTRDTTWVSLLQRYLDHPQGQVRGAAREAIESLTLRQVSAVPRAAEGRPDLNMDWEAFSDARPSLVLETTQGTVRVVLAHEEAPLTVQTFLRLAEAGAHDGVPFHRVVPGFVVQGGDVGRLDGTGGPGFSIRTELTRIPFDRGVIGMASSGRDTEGSQFFIMHGSAPHLEDRYTSFGWVVEGMEVVDRLLRGDRVLGVEVAEPGGG
ncbi:MAG: peptidylprolyl isomerase, partial [Gemmatimonadota bacterium]|nr:peptidylprolyl isomerase [Gemmatimonadota bacterium]